MKAALPLLLLLAACAPAPARPAVQSFEGSARVLLTVQSYRLTYTEDPATHAIRGTLENRSSGDAFRAEGTLLPGPDGDILTADVSAGDVPRVNATVFGFGIKDLPLKAGAQLSGTIRGDLLRGSLRVNGFRSALTMTRVR
ncbi:hypothetical protein HNQ07_000915 [Deinococcus metalli]|uniref:Uncharacterized protein n=1 Tax=Deinococcus metalli TaxID=1141878 RepID=A0A7W8NN87_9DEIO|nr:hypothetical protein [Deinococcus metalli]MBB5375471.1 hypothetical protein [Deinococcus metalli]GHF29034.1 hypothetical protein GCM10017781_01250 [Deinococcus metalli]